MEEKRLYEASQCILCLPYIYNQVIVWFVRITCSVQSPTQNQEYKPHIKQKKSKIETKQQNQHGAFKSNNRAQRLKAEKLSYSLLGLKIHPIEVSGLRPHANFHPIVPPPKFNKRANFSNKGKANDTTHRELLSHSLTRFYSAEQGI